MKQHPPVLFSKVDGEFGFFSNFSPHTITMDGKVWPTVEHYFQAQKFADPAIQEEIRSAKSPMIAARLGRSRERPLRADWDDVKVDVMLAALRQKAAEHPIEANSLFIKSAGSELIEHQSRRGSKFWGDGGDGSGQNMLGKLWMQLREERRQWLGRDITDPIGQLLYDLQTLRRPSEGWLRTWGVHARPVAAAWQASTDPMALCQFISTAGIKHTGLRSDGDRWSGDIWYRLPLDDGTVLECRSSREELLVPDKRYVNGGVSTYKLKKTGSKYVSQGSVEPGVFIAALHSKVDVDSLPAADQL